MTRKENQAILVIVTGLLILYLWLGSVYFVHAATAIAFVSLVSPKIGRGMVWVWFKIAEVLGFINSRIILGLMFYLLLTPISLLYRLFNKERLMIPRKERLTTFTTRDHKYTAEDLNKPW